MRDADRGEAAFYYIPQSATGDHHHSIISKAALAVVDGFGTSRAVSIRVLPSPPSHVSSALLALIPGLCHLVRLESPRCLSVRSETSYDMRWIHS